MPSRRFLQQAVHADDDDDQRNQKAAAAQQRDGSEFGNVGIFRWRRGYLSLRHDCTHRFMIPALEFPAVAPCDSMRVLAQRQSAAGGQGHRPPAGAGKAASCATPDRSAPRRAMPSRRLLEQAEHADDDDDQRDEKAAAAQQRDGSEFGNVGIFGRRRGDPSLRHD